VAVLPASGQADTAPSSLLHWVTEHQSKQTAV